MIWLELLGNLRSTPLFAVGLTTLGLFPFYNKLFLLITKILIPPMTDLTTLNVKSPHCSGWLPICKLSVSSRTNILHVPGLLPHQVSRGPVPCSPLWYCRVLLMWFAFSSLAPCWAPPAAVCYLSSPRVSHGSGTVWGMSSQGLGGSHRQVQRLTGRVTLGLPRGLLSLFVPQKASKDQREKSDSKH